tara:strand:+ start:83 stop:427 length:345 start_codon:yes stop_codon:yes gene_type:complete
MTKRKPRKRYRRKDYYANRIDEVTAWDAEDEITPFSIDDGLQASISWDLPPAFCGIIRSYWQNGRVEERAYRSPSAANRYMMKCLENDCEFTLLTDDMIRDTIADYDHDDELPF